MTTHAGAEGLLSLVLDANANLLGGGGDDERPAGGGSGYRGGATRSEGGELDEVKEEAMTLRDLTADLQSGQVRIMYDTTFH